MRGPRLPKAGRGLRLHRTLGLHPLLATRASTGEVLHVRQRKGSANTARGAVRFLSELVARVRRAGATGALTVRADSGFWSEKFLGTCRRLSVAFSITVRQIPQVKEAIAQIPEADWTPIDYTDRGEAQVAETTYKGDRLVVRRTRLDRSPGRAVAGLATPCLRHRPGGRCRITGR